MNPSAMLVLVLLPTGILALAVLLYFAFREEESKEGL